MKDPGSTEPGFFFYKLLIIHKEIVQQFCKLHQPKINCHEYQLQRATRKRL
jgi:hypothetical protein